MTENVEEKNRRFLDKFMSKDKVKAKAEERERKYQSKSILKSIKIPREIDLEAIYAEYSDWFAKLTPEQKYSRIEWVKVWKPWAKKIREEEDKIIEKKKLRYPLIQPYEFQSYQEREHGSPTKLSKKEKDEIMNRVLIKTPAIKKSESKNLKKKRKRP